MNDLNRIIDPALYYHGYCRSSPYGFEKCKGSRNT
jgi:hypothetical protein